MAFTRPHRRAIAIILGLTLFAAALGVLEPLVLRHIFDSLTGASDLEAALIGVGVFAAVGVAREIDAGIATWLTWRTRLAIQYALLGATVERLHRLPTEFHKSEGVGAVMTRLDRGIQGFVGALNEIAFNLVPAIAYLVFGLIVMFALEWRLTLVVLAFAPIPALIAARAAPAQTHREQTLLESWSKIYSRFNEVLSGLVTVRSFAMEDVEKSRFLGAVSSANQVVVRGVGFDTRVGAAQNAVAMIARVCAIGLGAVLIARGQITIGTLVAFLGYVGGAFGPVQNLAGMYKTLRTATVSIDTIFSILDAQEHLGDAPDAIEVTGLRGDVEIEDVHFGYRPERPILSGVDLRVRAGETVALVGPSGSGKSTIMSLLQRFYDPWQGEVRVDGIDVRRLKQSSLRRQIGVVLQEPVLFNDSVAANIAYGRPDATPAQVEAAARAAHAADFIELMPQGYQTKVGERGALLSVGERQRIAIARALLKDPAILILDEATSALDAESEALVQEAIDRLVVGRTTMIIAHRLATVVNADRIVVLRHGKVIEEGSHDALLRASGYYASLVAKQSRGMLPERE
ncbi:MAG: ABC transporter ATP-binding protein/permease [Myxococcota bacterium]|nr:ABC transporter ATP-binding protein/permease [Myxococcota bacterium]